MKSRATIRKHIKQLREFIDKPTSVERSREAIIYKRLAYLVEVVLRYETEDVVGWRGPINEVMEEGKILLRDLEGE